MNVLTCLYLTWICTHWVSESTKNRKVLHTFFLKLYANTCIKGVFWVIEPINQSKFDILISIRLVIRFNNELIQFYNSHWSTYMLYQVNLFKNYASTVFSTFFYHYLVTKLIPFIKTDEKSVISIANTYILRMILSTGIKI